GMQQAEAVANALGDAPITAVYSSPMERAVQTAEPLAARLSLPVHIHPGLIEIDPGDWQGKSIKQLTRTKLWKIVQHKPSEFCFPGGETFVNAQQRVVAALEEIKAGSGEKDMIACFSHSDTIKLAVSHYLAMPLDAFQRINIETASITALALGEGSPFLINANHVLNRQYKKTEESKKNRRSRCKTS
ncbi:MAG TPA: histidine phosphatase family protein, partial [Levilinea sp.]|nr:histidine phosphatase family protein [Levilinea sp.]